ncbi:TetR/AcrR family transcriptional regulator [Ponticaulis koreensis]|uniref:TetR/AcrR family transcriptional regulator n=1 Tax=Ponticaulis koreensis TaxID=1123045 RepID=UPI0003B4541F|nr:TetR/AcrR family transcriptional regulator [Ponticaulis koreensis]
MNHTSDLLSSSQRRILRAANSVFLEGGVMPISLAAVADQANVSRSLIYSHFPTQHDLMNGVLQLHLSIIARVNELARRSPSEKDALTQSALAYFDGMLEEGPTLALAPNDSFLSGRMNEAFQAASVSCLHALARAAKRLFKVSSREAISSIVMLKSLPDEAALLAWSGQIEAEICRETLEDSFRRAIDSMTYHNAVYPAG